MRGLLVLSGMSVMRSPSNTKAHNERCRFRNTYQQVARFRNTFAIRKQRRTDEGQGLAHSEMSDMRDVLEIPSNPKNGGKHRHRWVLKTVSHGKPQYNCACGARK